MPKVEKILAPTDFSELSKLGVRYALDMARDRRAELIVYHVIDLGEGWKGIHAEVTPGYHDMLEDNRRLLDKFIRDNFSERDSVKLTLIVEFGAAFKNVVELAERENVDVIVMSTHGRTGLDHMILGSVTEKVIARAPCPVLVVPRRTRRPLPSVA